MPSWGKITGNESDAFAKLQQGLAWAEEAAMEIAQARDDTSWIAISMLMSEMRKKVHAARAAGKRGLILPN